LLILPSRAKVPFELWVLFKQRISMGRQHFAVRIDTLTPLPFSLFEEQLQVMQVMAGDDDERAFFDGQRYLSSEPECHT
jgi:hypothetical protein